MSTAKPGLLEFVAEKKAAKTACVVCRLPQREEIDKGRSSGATYPQIQEWLKTHHDTTINEDTLRRHFRQGHHEPKADAR